MATESNLSTRSATAAADLSAKQYFFVKLTAARTVDLAADGESAYGVLQDKPASGRTGCVAVSGQTKCVAGAAIAAGDKVASDANGKAKVAVSGDYVLGLAVTAAGADLVVFDLELASHGLVA